MKFLGCYFKFSIATQSISMHVVSAFSIQSYWRAAARAGPFCGREKCYREKDQQYVLHVGKQKILVWKVTDKNKMFTGQNTQNLTMLHSDIWTSGSVTNVTLCAECAVENSVTEQHKKNAKFTETVSTWNNAQIHWKIKYFRL